MKLYLVRHAKTEPFHLSGKDHNRQLLPRGRQQARDLSAFLHSSAHSIRKVLCSDAKRTKETWKLLADNCPATVEFHEKLYLAEHLEILKLISQQKDATDLMILGHNDGISALASYLTGDNLHMKTGALLVLEFHGESWNELSADTATLIQSYRSSAD